ncbi:MAG TPA: electron transfer flavoprotein subunit alpha/FixB family protein [Conexibacter sp.]
MSTILTIAEARRGELSPVSHELIAAGASLAAAAGARHLVAVASADAEALADGLARSGVDELLTVTTPTEHFDAHVAQQAAEALIEAEDPVVVLLGHTVDSLGFAPAVAARGGHGFASDVTELRWEDGPVAVRGAYGGKLAAELDFPGKSRAILLLRSGTFAPAIEPASPPRRAVEVAFGAPAAEHRGFTEAASGDLDITQSEFLLSVGRGIGEQENLPRFEALAEAMGATLSVSRPLVDAGWQTSARQVGQSGKTVTPKVYLALGISGAVQHVAGIRGAETIIAVNSDPEAPIFRVAHYGAVADLFEVADALERHFA